MENFQDGKFRAIPDFALFRKFAGINSTFHVYNFRVVTHEKREIKNTSKIFLPVRYDEVMTTLLSGHTIQIDVYK